jgi:hypothetical protein
VSAIAHRDHDEAIEALDRWISWARRAFGFHSARAIIALAMLTLGGHRPELPR